MPKPLIGVLGGRFDPPHLGHLALARSAVEHFGIDELHVSVIEDAAHKRSEAPAADRLELARLTFAEPNLEFRAIVELEKHRYTVDALEASGYDDPIFLIGADELAALPTWKEPERVLELARLGVAARPGYEPPVTSARVELFELEPHAISSSDLRGRVRKGESLDGLVVPAVAEYIAARRLYSSPGRLH